MHDRQALPGMVKHLHSCQHCNQNNACLIYHKAVENGDGTSSGLGGWFEMKTKHINENAARFFRHWQRLIDHEEEDIDYIRKDIWRQPGEVREMAGK